MAGNDDHDGIFPAGRADGTDSLGFADAPRDLSVRHRFSVGNFSDRFPDSSLEWSSFGFDGYREGGAFA